LDRYRPSLRDWLYLRRIRCLSMRKLWLDVRGGWDYLVSLSFLSLVNGFVVDAIILVSWVLWGNKGSGWWGW
jgi:hypothetical protein